MGYLPARRRAGVDIALKLEPGPGGAVSGTVSVGFAGRYDGVVINTQVLGYSGLLGFRSCNGRRPGGVGRLFVPREEVDGGEIRFEASPEFEHGEELEAKVRASIIEQHKEIESASAFVRLSPSTG